MRQNKNLYKGRPELSITLLESHSKAWLTVSLKVNPSRFTSQCTGVLLPTTAICSSTSASSIGAHSFSLSIGRLSPFLLASLQRTEDCTIKWAATQTVSFQTDSGFADLPSSSLLSKFSTGL